MPLPGYFREEKYVTSESVYDTEPRDLLVLFDSVGRDDPGSGTAQGLGKRIVDSLVGGFPFRPLSKIWRNHDTGSRSRTRGLLE